MTWSFWLSLLAPAVIYITLDLLANRPSRQRAERDASPAEWAARQPQDTTDTSRPVSRK